MTHTFGAEGTYQVGLTVADSAAATGTATHAVTVTAAQSNQPPTASFTSSCVRLSCTFDGSASSDQDGSVVSYAWTFGDGDSGSGITPSHTYRAGGPEAVTLTVTDDQGATDSVTHQVTPVASIAADTFARTVTNGWGSADVGGAWSLSGTTSAFSVAGATGQVRLAAPSVAPTASLASVSATNVDLLVDVSADKVATGNGITVVLIARKSGSNSYRLKLRLLPAGVLHLAWSRVVSGTEKTVTEIVVPNLTYGAGDGLRTRFVLVGSGASTTVSGAVWKAGTSEPAAQLRATDGTAELQSAGSIAIQSALGSTATDVPVTLSYDNLLMVDSTSG